MTNSTGETTSSRIQPQQVRSLFSEIASSYDRTNDLMTFGLARKWREDLVRWSLVKKGDQVLDAATGTGDLAIAFKRAIGENGRATGIDFCNEMLAVAPQKAKRLHLDVQFKWADVTALPFADQQFDVVSIAYGLRNIVDRELGIKEMHRVLKPGGRLMILETGDSSHSWMGPLLRLHFKIAVPLIGAFSSGSKSAYEYLKETSSRFPSREDLCRQIHSAAPFACVEYKSLWGGASYMYRATKAL